ncbi:hypothetical protein [Actinoplanes sp. NPDC026619]|uniref:hypothetical protein n=1 Tax=Actinoplanes sp. NPDC026619 TaxID=3155798 RepID=UPI0033E9BFEE
MSAPVVFRWGLWKATPEYVEMLSHSIGTFRHFFGPDAAYVVYADDPSGLVRDLLVDAEVRPLDPPGAQYLDPRATWLKWAPRFRHDPAATEFRVDADIFLLDDPVELREFIAGDGTDVLVTQEEYVERWPYGNYGPRLADGFVPINAGLVGQRAGCDLSEEIAEEYRWWSHFVEDHEVLYHDEQGAVAWVLQRYAARGRLRLLEHTRYRVVCPTNAVPVERLDGLVAMHATYPDHPAYHRFRSEISRVSGVLGGSAPADLGR